MKNVRFILFALLVTYSCFKTSAAESLVSREDSLINTKAPDFKLKDLEGKTVQLSKLKGKIVVLDFWATWCGPCKASFPGAQLAVEKYRNDPSVVFLFIDIKEKKSNYVEEISQFIADNHYSFRVLLDEKGSDGIQNMTFKKFNFPGIPAKVIINQDGLIKEHLLGNDPDKTAQQNCDELVSKIESIRNKRTKIS